MLSSGNCKRIFTTDAFIKMIKNKDVSYDDDFYMTLILMYNYSYTRLKVANYHWPTFARTHLSEPPFPWLSSQAYMGFLVQSPELQDFSNHGKLRYR